MKAWILILTLLVISIIMQGCGMVEGLGQDLQAGSRATRTYMADK